MGYRVGLGDLDFRPWLVYAPVTVKKLPYVAIRSHQEQFEKIRTNIYPDPSGACKDLAQEIAGLVEARDREGRPSVLGLATGSTPVPLYRELVRLHLEEGLSFANVVTFNLDEYYGVGDDHPESYHRFMHEQLFQHVDIPPKNVHIPDGTAAMDDVFAACEHYEKRIAEVGGIDLQILGIGRTGHIGFNEPGSTRESRTRLIALDRVTREDATPDFLAEENVPRFAVTMGVGTILEARKIVLVAWGENKADVIAQAVEGPVCEAVSASFLQGHADARIVVDRAAASSLKRERLPWLVGPVDWNPDLTCRAVTWLAEKKGKPVLKLVDGEYNENGMGELLTREGSAYRLNILIFNQLQHTITGWPGGKRGADDSNRPERAKPYPKRVLVFGPEPEDDILSMAGTIERLVDQGHEVTVAYQTSGALRVSDAAARKYALTLLEQAEGVGGGWEEQVGYARLILDQVESKGAFGEHPPELRHLKALIRRGEAREACAVLGLAEDRVRFLDLPFYEKGRYRRFRPTAADTEAHLPALVEIRPHQIYATGHLADPSSVEGLCFQVLEQALAQLPDGAWYREDCRLWLYRGRQPALAPYEVAMAVPMSPDQLALKVGAIQKFSSHTYPDNHDGHQNQFLATRY